MKKKCTKCNLSKSPENFYTDKRNLSGLQSRCKQCELSYRKGFYIKNRKEKLNYSKKYAENNKEKIKEYAKNNRHKTNLRAKRWRQRNPDKVRVLSSIRRARKLNAMPNLNEEELKDIKIIYKVTRFLSKYEGIEYHVDHIIPLSKGGLHHPCNLQILTAEENLKKGSKLWQ